MRRLRHRTREGRVYEAYEEKNKREKLRCLLLRRKKKNIYFLFMKWEIFYKTRHYSLL
jgi:hypothetical protein